MNVYTLIFRWVKKRRHCLLICACIISLLWLFFLGYYNFRTLSVSGKNWQHEFRTSRDLPGKTEIGPHKYRLYSDKEQSAMKNDRLKFVQNRRNVTDRVKETRRADFVTSPTIRILPTDVIKNDTQYSNPRESNATGNLITELLRTDHPIKQLLGRQNRSLSSSKYKLLEDASITDKPSPVKPVSIPLLAGGDKPSGFFEHDILRLPDRYQHVVLSVVDSGYINFAINFQRLSIDSIGLHNFLFVCTDRQAVYMLRQHGIACSYFHKHMAAQGIIMAKSLKKTSPQLMASDFGTVDYFQKSNAKTAVVLDVLKRGYAVLMIDPDVILFKNPFPYFNCTSCDVHFQMDRDMYNSGFVFVRPTSASIRLYETAWDLYIKYHKAHDQAYINTAIDQLNGDSRRGPAVQIQVLPRDLFPCGVYYFEHQHRMFENKPPCVDCVMAHNNYLGSVAAKIYRFKENLLWTVDENGYYSDPTARFITYENPVYLGPNTTRFELEALKSALAVAEASGRILILPSFHCCWGCMSGSRARCSSPQFRCSLLSVLRISTFHRIFGNRYREHSFLSNSLVPDHIKRSLSNRPLFVNASVSKEVRHSMDKNSVEVVNVANSSSGATLVEVVRWISQRNETAVIRFHSFYGNSVDWTSDVKFGFKLKRQFDIAFECSEYEQWDTNMLNPAKMWPEKNSTKH